MRLPLQVAILHWWEYQNDDSPEARGNQLLIWPPNNTNDTDILVTWPRETLWYNQEELEQEEEKKDSTSPHFIGGKYNPPQNNWQDSDNTDPHQATHLGSTNFLSFLDQGMLYLN